MGSVTADTSNWQTLHLVIYTHEISISIKIISYSYSYSYYPGERLGKALAWFPIGYLSSGTCSALIMMGGSTLKIFYQIVCDARCSQNLKPLTTVEWCLVFTCAAVVLSQLPNLNSMAGVSLVGAISAVAYCSLIWVVSVREGRLPEVSYIPVGRNTEIRRIRGVLNALGIVAFAFRGHNLILEIQVIKDPICIIMCTRLIKAT